MRLEREVGKVSKERASLLLERRRQDITDQDRECAETGGCGFLVDLRVSEAVWVWSAGQVVGDVAVSQRRAVEREGRRRRRREGRERESKVEREEHRQGMSTDDELLETNRLKFESNMSEWLALQRASLSLPPLAGKALAGAEGVFEDVVEEFWQLPLITQRLEDWKFGFPDSYSQAHIPLHLPRLFSPLARLDLLHWNPLEVREDFSLISALSSFSLRRTVRILRT